MMLRWHKCHIVNQPKVCRINQLRAISIHVHYNYLRLAVSPSQYHGSIPVQSIYLTHLVICMQRDAVGCHHHLQAAMIYLIPKDQLKQTLPMKTHLKSYHLGKEVQNSI